ncbi:MAG: hypothetical protein IKC65_02850 [Lentisphaeria bacterium]|nr:hypothetical protein [Lentisphaeria bacterium]
MIRFLPVFLCCSALLYGAELPCLSPLPVLTGKPGHPGWKKAARYDFPQKDTYALIGRSKTHLYIAVRSSHGSINDRIATMTAHDSPVYMNDCLDVFFNTTGKKDYYQVIANTNGTVCDLRTMPDGKQDLQWDSGAKAAGSYGKDSFYIELAVPLAAFAPMDKGFAMMINSYQRWRLKGVRILGQAHRPDTFTRFELKEAYPVKLLSVDAPAFSGLRTFSYTLENTSSRKLSLTGSCGGSPVSMTLAPQEKKILKCPVRLDSTRLNDVTLILKENEQEILRVTRLLKVRKALEVSLKSDIIYKGEALPLLIKVNEPQTEPVLVEYQDGKITCSYKDEKASFSCKTIPSPWD